MTKPAPAQVSKEEAVEELLHAAFLLLRRLRAEVSADGLTWSQTAVLGTLRKQGPMTTADLARAESVKPQSMGATLAFLEEQGLVERRPHPTDGRQVLFALTQAALVRMETRSRLKREWLTSAVATLDPTEQRALLDAAALVQRIANS
jgi:DNA-binding MarR family transcriptional regulator